MVPEIRVLLFAYLGSFSELFHLSVDDEMTHTQLLSSLVKPNKKSTPVQTADHELD